MEHDFFLRRCLELAACGRGSVGNGALVGAILVRNGNIIAQHHHVGFGKPHAERALLTNFTSAIGPEDILYVNLEPCCHHGKTPPCTDIIMARGVKRLVYGMKDPDKRVSGQGISILRKAGVEVTGPVLEQDSAWLNRGFVSVRTKKRPWITLKMAQTRAGKFFSSDGSKLKITDLTQDAWAHEYLRARHDAILVGIGTVEKDDPKLNTRFIQNPPKSLRIILDPALRIDEKSYVLTHEPETTILVVSDDMADSIKSSRIANAGSRIFSIPFSDRRFDWKILWNTLTAPSSTFHGITSLLVEGGPRTWDAFRSSGFSDMEVTLVGN